MRLLTPYWPEHRSEFNELFKTASEFIKTGQVPWDVIENETGFQLSLEVPGYKESEIEIEVNGNTLAVTGKRDRAGKKLEFKQSFTLPNTVQADAIQAHQEDGVLEITLQKTQAAVPRKIAINSSREATKSAH